MRFGRRRTFPETDSGPGLNFRVAVATLERPPEQCCERQERLIGFAVANTKK